MQLCLNNLKYYANVPSILFRQYTFLINSESLQLNEKMYRAFILRSSALENIFIANLLKGPCLQLDQLKYECQQTPFS